MAWQRSGDTGATHPALMAVRGDPKADSRTINEVAGFIWRLSMQSGAHLTDYVLDVGTIEMIGGPSTNELLRLCLKQGLLTRLRAGGITKYKLIDDPDFIHLRSRAEVEWERQQRNDGRDLTLQIPVLLRDGDQCRWCGIGVVWRGRKTKRSGEWDHLQPGEPATVATLVVACRGCNSARGGNVEAWDSAHTLRLPPAPARYGVHTAKLLSDNGYLTDPTDDEERPAPALGADTAPTGVRPATGLSDDPAPAPAAAPGISAEVARESVPRSDRSTHAGSGRVGPGLGSGEGEGLPGAVPATPLPGRRRGRRGGRTTSTGPPTTPLSHGLPQQSSPQEIL